jgi:hypothetical protein
MLHDNLEFGQIVARWPTYCGIIGMRGPGTPTLMKIGKSSSMHLA